ncbi:glycoside hydrolase family 43 protein [Marinimicrobium locisalis]|uniref:glycoside hydrolase family 43 protein n=1 Tax=Marinimicrobium locisalis TaxID=546022 RepID=UPI0032219723
MQKLMLASFAILTAAALGGCVTPGGPQARNPIIWADVPDVSVIRVENTYYMSSTTMHMSPGLPIMKSDDLVNWELASYAYDTLVDNEAMNLQRGQNAYGKGSWASSLRYHEGRFYVSTFSDTSGKTHIFSTEDVTKSNWREQSFEPVLHDHTLFFEEGRVYMVYGSGDIRLVELEDDLSGIKEGGINKVIIPDAGAVAGDDIMLPAEGSQLYKVNGYYYLFNITWPQDDMRTVVIHRAEKLTGPYEGRVALQDEGIAQGGLVQTPSGDWYAMLFGDRGAVGRIPYLVPVHWQDGWPVLGENGTVPDRLNVPVENSNVSGLVQSDDFSTPTLPLAWQWNHNPHQEGWSLTDRPGHLRLTNHRLVDSVLQTRNTLTQRTFGPKSHVHTKLDVSGLRDGDVAGLLLLQKHYGYVGVKQENGQRSVVMVSAEKEGDASRELASHSVEQSILYLKAEADFRKQKDRAQFFYSLDGEQWTPIGEPLKMSYTLPHFMGYRFGLFNFATETQGGTVDFDYFRIAPPQPIVEGPRLKQ